MPAYKVYRGNQVDGATPLGLVVLTHDALHKSLLRSRMAIQAGDLNAEANQSGLAMEALIELATSLNMEEGGEVAANLASLYAYMMNRLSQSMFSESVETIDELLQLVETLNEGWKGLEQQNGKQADGK